MDSHNKCFIKKRGVPPPFACVAHNPRVAIWKTVGGKFSSKKKTSFNKNVSLFDCRTIKEKRRERKTDLRGAMITCAPPFLNGTPSSLWTSVQRGKKKHISVENCFTIPFPCFPFCHFSIILGISVRQALFLKLPLFHRFLYFTISTSSSSVEQTEVETWGNRAATVTC